MDRLRFNFLFSLKIIAIHLLGQLTEKGCDKSECECICACPCVCVRACGTVLVTRFKNELGSFEIQVLTNRLYLPVVHKYQVQSRGRGRDKGGDQFLLQLNRSAPTFYPWVG